jgi:hypothetical protein
MTRKGMNGETITSLSSNVTAGQFQQHRIAIAGNGAGPIFVAQAQFNVGLFRSARCLAVLAIIICFQWLLSTR